MSNYWKSQLLIFVHGWLCGVPLYKAINSGDWLLGSVALVMGMIMVLGYRYPRRDVIESVKQMVREVKEQ